MKKILACLLCLVISICSTLSVTVFAEENETSNGSANTKPDIQVGMSVLSIDEAALNTAGYEFIDDIDSNIAYGWPYNLYHRPASEKAYGGGVIFSMGQVSATISYMFSGTYIAVVFAETYWAAEVVVSVDGVEYGSFTPHNASVEKEKPGDSKVIFVKDDLADGEHIVTVSHRTAYTTGEENVKTDGKAYYDNDAFFDCFIVEKAPNTEKVPADTVAVGTIPTDCTEELLDNLNLKIIDDNDEEIQYEFAYNLGARFDCPTAYGGKVLMNHGQVSSTFSYDFEGTYLAVAFAETYYACTIYIDVDGEILAEITPHNPLKVADGSQPVKSKVIFATDELSAGWHTVTIYHDTAFTTGEDNVREDGNAYYDNYALFDCLFVQKVPDEPVETPTPEPTATPAPTETPETTAPVSSNAPETKAPASTDGGKNEDEKSNSNTVIIIVVIAMVVIAVAAIAILVIKKKGKGVNR